MPVKKKKVKKAKSTKKIRADMREAVNQIPALLAAESEKYEKPKPDDRVEYNDLSTTDKPEKPETYYDENIHNRKMIWLWGAVSIFTILVVIMWFLNTKLIVKKYTESSFNPLTNSQTEIALIKKTLQSSNLQGALDKVRVSNTDIIVSEALKKEIPEILSSLTSSTQTMTPTSTTSTPVIVTPTTTTNTITNFPTSTELMTEESKINLPVSANTSTVSPSL